MSTRSESPGRVVKNDLQDALRIFEPTIPHTTNFHAEINALDD